MQHNLNSCILFSSPFVSQRKKTEQPLCIVLLHFLTLIATDKPLVSKHKLVGTLVSSEANLQTTASPTSSAASGTASLFSSTQMQTSASLSHRSPWHLTQDFSEACSSAARHRFWSLMALQSKCWTLSAQNGRMVNTLQRKWEERGATFAEEASKGSARCSPVKRAVDVSDLTLHGHLPCWKITRRWVEERSEVPHSRHNPGP